MAVAAEERPRCCACGVFVRRRPDWYGQLSEAEELDDSYSDHDCPIQGGYVVPGGEEPDLPVARVYTLQPRRPRYASTPPAPKLPAQHAAREDWLRAARDIISAELLPLAGLELAKRNRLSCGFPPGNSKDVLGVTFHQEVSGDQSREIFVNPVLAQPAGLSQGVLAVLLHELIHACFPSPEKEGHGPRFAAACAELGFVGEATCNGAGEELDNWFRWSLLPRLGPYPHAAMDLGGMRPPSVPPGRPADSPFRYGSPRRRLPKRQTNRHRLWQCPGCGQKVRASRQDLDITCNPCGEAFVARKEA
jgi:hypothetical protein